MSVPKPNPNLWPTKPATEKPKRKRVRRHLTQKVYQNLDGKPDAEVLRTYHTKKEN